MQQRWKADSDCSFAVKFYIISSYSIGFVSDVEVYKTDTSKAMEVMCEFDYLNFNFNLHFDLNRVFLHSYLLLNMLLTGYQTKSLIDWLHILERLFVCLVINQFLWRCIFLSLGSSMAYWFYCFMTL